jgi:hypothetical protein
MFMATAQLHLLPHSKWLLDETTKRIGRAGLAQARSALASASPSPMLHTAAVPSNTVGAHVLNTLAFETAESLTFAA